MKNKLIMICCIVIFGNYALADSQSFGPIIQRQSRQIQELKARVLGLESTLSELKIALKRTGALTQGPSMAPVESLGEIVGDDAAEAILLPDSQNSFFAEPKETPARPKDRTDYDLALAALKDGNFESSERKFSDFILKYPSSKLQSNATFWYAETFYRRGVYNKSAINYLKSYKKYPTGSKAPDALLKLSYSLASLNKNKEACSMLDKLELEFPKRPISSIKRAKDAKEKFQCKK